MKQRLLLLLNSSLIFDRHIACVEPVKFDYIRLLMATSLREA
jgi:hypothetical protein